MLKKLIDKITGKSKKIMDFHTSMDLVGMPVVTFYQGDKKFHFILDTGANDCIIDSNILHKIKHTKGNVEATVTGIDGNETEGGGICAITLSFQGQNYAYVYQIQNLKGIFDSIKKETGVTLHGIIGSSFFNKFKYVLDFDKLIAYSKM